MTESILVGISGPCGCWQPSSLQEQPVLLIAEPISLARIWFIVSRNNYGYWKKFERSAQSINTAFLRGGCKMDLEGVSSNYRL